MNYKTNPNNPKEIAEFFKYFKRHQMIVDRELRLRLASQNIDELCYIINNTPFDDAVLLGWNLIVWLNTPEISMNAYNKIKDKLLSVSSNDNNKFIGDNYILNSNLFDKIKEKEQELEQLKNQLKEMEQKFPVFYLLNMKN